MTGKVASDKMDKTIVVTVSRRVMHPRYRKYIVRKSRFKAHDAKNECNVGDKVEIIEDRPRSKDKRWTLHRIIERGAQ